MKLFILIVCNIILQSCSKDELPKFNQLGTLRIIALTTPTPEVNPGVGVTITPFVSDINETGALKDTVQTCIDLGISYGVLPTCEGNPTKFVLHTDRTLAVPTLLDNRTGEANSFLITIPGSAIIFNSKSAQDQFNGVNYLVEYILTNTAGKQIKSFKRIVVSTKSPKNSNPAITDFFSDGVTMTTLPISTKSNLTSDLTSASIENYQSQDSNNLITINNESVSVTWFITDGETKYFRSEISQSNEYTGPTTAPTGRSAYIFAVARDNRGGATVILKKF